MTSLPRAESALADDRPWLCLAPHVPAAFIRASDYDTFPDVQLYFTALWSICTPYRSRDTILIVHDGFLHWGFQYLASPSLAQHGAQRQHRSQTQRIKGRSTAAVCTLKLHTR